MAYYATGDPPSYDEIDKKVEELKERFKKDPAFRKKVDDAVVKEIAKPDTMKQMLIDTDKLAENVRAVDASFESIRQKLYKVDLKEYKDEHGGVVKYELEWKGYQQRWDGLLKTSRSTATKTQAYIQDFTGVIVPMVLKIKTDKDLQDALTELRAFVSRKDPSGRKYNPEEAEHEATAQSEAFNKLKQDLADFQSRFDVVADYLKKKLEGEIADLHTAIFSAEAEIAVLFQKVLALGVGFLITGFATLAGGVILAAMGPLSWLGIAWIVLGALATAGEFVAFTVLLAQLIEKQNNLERLRSNLREKEKEQEVLKQLRSTLDDQKESITGLCARIDQMKNIWISIAHHADKIREALELAKDKKTVTGLQLKIDSIKVMYSTFDVALENYCTGTDPRTFRQAQQ